jgi:hypothetical protein
MSTKRKAEKQLDKDDIKKIKSAVESVLNTLTCVEEAMEKESPKTIIEFGNRDTPRSAGILLKNGIHILVSSTDGPGECPRDRDEDEIKLTKPDVISEQLEIDCRGERRADRLAAEEGHFDNVDSGDVEIDFDKKNFIHQLIVKDHERETRFFACDRLDEQDIGDDDIDWGDHDSYVHAKVNETLYVTVTMLATPFETHPIEGLVEYQKNLIKSKSTPTIASYIS